MLFIGTLPLRRGAWNFTA